MVKIFISYVVVMMIFFSSALAYSPQDNFVQQNMYEITGAYIGETVEELNQQNLLITDAIQGNTIPLKTVGIAGVILKKETIANIADNRLCSLVIVFDGNKVEKTKKIQEYFVNKLGKPTFITQPTEQEKQINITTESYTWESGTYHLTVAQGHISFSENILSRKILLKSIINYIEYCQGYMEYSKGNLSIQNQYYVGEKGKKMFEASMKTVINSYKKIFENDIELVNDIKAYFANKPEYGETLKLFFD